ncbi:MAG: CYTH domain-containing protein [Sporichthyaceae bacterium]
MATHHEIERKYEATNADRLPPWPELVPGTDVRVEDQLLIAAYFDTADHALLGSKITMRHRSGDDEAGWHLKLPAGLDARKEIQVEAPISAGPPAEFLEITADARAGAELAQIATLTTHRTLNRWYSLDGKLLLATTDDTVLAEIPGREPKKWRELEVELGEAGEVALLDDVEKSLAEYGVLRSDSPSKLSRAFEV